MTYQIGSIVQYHTGKNVVDAKVFRMSGDRLWIDHSTFSRARVIRQSSKSLLGVAS